MRHVSVPLALVVALSVASLDRSVLERPHLRPDYRPKNIPSAVVDRVLALSELPVAQPFEPVDRRGADMDRGN